MSRFGFVAFPGLRIQTWGKGQLSFGQPPGGFLLDRDRFTASCHLPSILRVSGFAVIQPAIVPKKIELPDNCKTVGNQSDDWRGVQCALLVPLLQCLAHVASVPDQ